MLLCAWFVDLKFREAVLETWSLTYSINVYIGMQLQEPQISDQLGISPKLIHLTLCLWQKNPGFRKNSLCSLIWPDFDSFVFANWPLKSSTNFWISWKICFCLWSAMTSCLLKGSSGMQFSMQIWTRESRAACAKHHTINTNLLSSPFLSTQAK